MQFAYDHGLDYGRCPSCARPPTSKPIDLMLTVHGRKLPIIAKIEKPEAFRHRRHHRGGRRNHEWRAAIWGETSPQDVPIVQKTLIHKCNLAGKPVITATQMLESMIGSPRQAPGRGQRRNNAILDGTDAVMLSAETAASQYPVEAVRMMKNIALTVETSEVFKTLVRKNVVAQESLLSDACPPIPRMPFTSPPSIWPTKSALTIW